MNFENIADVYAANDKIRDRLKEVIVGISDEQANLLPEGEKWTIASLVEHLALVEKGMTQISARLLSKAEAVGIKSDGRVHITKEFVGSISGAEKQKFEAPPQVQPTGDQSIAESLKQLDESRRRLNELRPLFETVGTSPDFTFPHPAFGNMNAHEWLALIGGHEARHTRQIQRLLDERQ